jgi:rhodanese-related sulfurtransferase
MHRKPEEAMRMPIPLKKTASQLVDEAMAQVRTLSLPEARALHEAGQALFVDLRDVRELEREGVIPGAVHAPRGMLEFWVDPASPYFHKAFEPAQEGRPMVLFCAAGWRSALATKALLEMGFPDVSHVEGGFAAWKAAGAPVAAKAPPRPKGG